MPVTVQAVAPDQLGPLKLNAFRCSPGCGDAAAVEAAVRSLTPEELGSDALVLCACDGSLTVGVAVAHPLAARPGMWTVPLLAVRIPWQGQGLGRRLKNACLDEIRSAGGERVVSSVHTETAAMHRINQTIGGSVWEAEPSGPGVVYSIDLSWTPPPET